MPITQQRMLALLAAASDFEQALDVAVATLSRESALADSGRMSHAEALANCRLMITRDSLLRSPLATRLALAAEAARWSPAKRLANAREAQAARQRRHAAKQQREEQGHE